MDTTALDGVPELYRRATAAVTTVGDLIAAGAPAADINYAADAWYRIAALMEDGAGAALAEIAGMVADARREGIREGRRQRDAEIAEEVAPPPRLALAPTG